MPEVSYCFSFTTTTLFTTMLTVIIVVCSLKSKYAYAKFRGCCVNELYVHGHLCPYCNVWLEAVFFTRIALFIKLFTYLYDQS